MNNWNGITINGSRLSIHIVYNVIFDNTPAWPQEKWILSRDSTIWVRARDFGTVSYSETCLKRPLKNRRKKGLKAM